MLELLTIGSSNSPKIVSADIVFSTLPYMRLTPRGWTSSLLGNNPNGGWMSDITRPLDLSPFGDLSKLKRISGVWSGSYLKNVYSNLLGITLSDGKYISLGILDDHSANDGQWLRRGLYPDPATRQKIDYTNIELAFEVPEGTYVKHLTLLMGGIYNYAQNDTHGVKDLVFEFH